MQKRRNQRLLSGQRKAWRVERGPLFNLIGVVSFQMVFACLLFGETSGEGMLVMWSMFTVLWSSVSGQECRIVAWKKTWNLVYYPLFLPKNCQEHQCEELLFLEIVNYSIAEGSLKRRIKIWPHFERRKLACPSINSLYFSPSRNLPRKFLRFSSRKWSFLDSPLSRSKNALNSPCRKSNSYLRS